MDKEQYQRKLVVILSADAAGYARLTEQNELSVHTLLKERLELIRLNTHKLGGEIIRIHGDGCLCVFDSIIHALKAALEIQQSSTLLNSNLSKNNQILFRIGIHLSEVIFDQCEPYGNGVNIAVRLQQKANPGDILVSRKTITSLDTTKGFIFSKTEKIKVKNISQPIHCSRLSGTCIYDKKPPSIKAFTPHIYYFAAFSLLSLFLYSYIDRIKDLNSFNAAEIEDIHYLNSSLEPLPFNAFEYRPDFGKKFQIISSAPQKIIKNSDNLNSNLILANLVTDLNRLTNDVHSLKNDLTVINNHNESYINATTHLLIEQNSFLEDLVNQKESNHFMYASHGKPNHNASPINYSPIEDPISSQQLINSLNTLEYTTVDNTDIKFSERSSNDESHYGCMSCVNRRHIENRPINNKKSKHKSKAILVGNILNENPNHFGEKTALLQNFIYQKLQHSITQSKLGNNIEEFSWINSQENKEFNEEYFVELCSEPNTVLIASYELYSGYWDASGAKLHFHHCITERSVHYFERNLSPTIYNVNKPYLTEEALSKVYKSVDYMVDKIVPNNEDLL